MDQYGKISHDPCSRLPAETKYGKKGDGPEPRPGREIQGFIGRGRVLISAMDETLAEFKAAAAKDLRASPGGNYSAWVPAATAGDLLDAVPSATASYGMDGGERVTAADADSLDDADEWWVTTL